MICPSGTDFEVRDWGFAVRSITKQMAVERSLDDLRGVLVSGVKGGGPAEQGGLAPRDIVRFVGETPINDLEEFRAIYRELSDAERARIMLKVKRRDSSRFVLLKLDNGEG